MTATPHNGKEEDFQLFMALLDGDRFEGKFRDGVHIADASDLMRRMVKEHCSSSTARRFSRSAGLTPSTTRFPTAKPPLQGSHRLRARGIQPGRSPGKRQARKGTVGFALTILQRRLASSPEAIYQSLQRRRERLEKRLREEQLLKRGAEVGST